MYSRDSKDSPRDNIVVRFFKSCWTFIRRAIFTVGLMVIISICLTVMALNRLADRAEQPLPQKILLTYTFKDQIGETAAKPSFDQPLLRSSITMTDFIQTLDRAGKDARVVGLATDIEDLDLSFAQVQEVRQALARFRAAGKFTSVYATSYGGLGAGMGDYYLASAFDDIWMQPVGLVNINGLALEVPFLKGTLDKIGVEAQFAHKGIYKSAPESLTSTGMSAATRENMTALLDDLSAQVMGDIAEGRKISVGQMVNLRDQSPFMDKQALDAKLVDHIGYFDEMADAAKAKVSGDKTKNVDLFDYARRTAKEKSGGMTQAVEAFIQKEKDAKNPEQAKVTPQIAVIVGSGEISASAGGSGFGEGGIKSDKIAAAFKAAQKNKNVVAVVFRIDSPGGSPEAAETIRRALIQTQKAGKPVVVSMGGYAASGGYWVAAPADKIVAQPGTVTGSIGVFGGKMVMSGLWDKIGLSFETLTAGKNAGMWSANRSFTAEEYAKYDGLLQGIYDAFVARVAEGRKMPVEKVKTLAEGRIYTGRQAKEVGLVDTLGGIDDAIKTARVLANVPEGQETPLIMYPPRKSPLEMFISMATEGEVLMPRFNISADQLVRAMSQVATPQPVEMPKINCCK